MRWAGDMSQRAIDEGRADDRKRKASYYEAPSVPEETSSATGASIIAQAEGKPNKPTLPARIQFWWKQWKE